jgi:tyrosyl-tRNA synthetase
MMIMNAFEELQWRGLVYDYIEGTPELLTRGPVTIYNGFDATADSLHVGHLVPLLALGRLQRFGHRPIALAGGGTSMIGDPSGRTSERLLLSSEQIAANVEAIKPQLARFLDFETNINPARVMNNAEWLLPLNLIEFMRDIGKHFTVNYMLAKESVKTRLEREEGISLTEFTYMLLQSYDYLHLFDSENCVLQTGGSDQWGNITAGVDLIRRVRGKPAYAMVYPLITKADGTKFGKSETGTVWLSAARTSPYRFYQFWLNTDDKDVINYLKYFTFLPKEEIEALAVQTEEHPEAREAQRVLAQQVTEMVHGPEALERARQASQVLFGGELRGLSAAEIEDIFAEVPSIEMPKNQLEGPGMNILDLSVTSGSAASKGEARRKIAEGGIYLNNERVTDVNACITLKNTLEGKFIVMRKGRKDYHLVKVVG